MEAYDINEDVTVRCTYAFRLVRGKLRSTSYRSEVIGDARNDEVLVRDAYETRARPLP